MNILKSKKTGVILSYAMIAVNAVSSIALVPLYLKYLGIEGYGFYQMIYAVANYILILDFGISTTMVRFLTEYRTLGQKKKAENFAAHVALLVLLICVTIFLIGLIINKNLGSIYATLTYDKILLGQKIFTLMLVVLAFTVIEHYMEGIVMAYEYFSVAKIIGIIKLILKIVLAVIFLRNSLGVMSLVYCDLAVLAFSLLIYIFYNFCYLRFKIRFYQFERSIFLPMAAFMLAIMLQSIVAYLNNTVDKVILGMMLGEKASGIYSLSMTFITLFNMIPTSILTIFLPQATKMVIEKSGMEKHTELATSLGRYQMAVCGGILCAFLVLGRDFITLWAGSDAKIIWLVALIIMIPNAVPLIQNYCLNVLDALNKRLFRSLVLLGLSLMNIILTVLMIKWWGVIGAPIATGIAYIVGHGFIMNFYYDKKIGINIKKMWSGICHGLLPSVLVSAVVTYPLTFIEGNTWIIFIGKALVWSAIYLLIIWLIGLNGYEKKIFISLVKKFFRKKGNA